MLYILSLHFYYYKQNRYTVVHRYNMEQVILSSLSPSFFSTSIYDNAFFGFGCCHYFFIKFLMFITKVRVLQTPVVHWCDVLGWRGCIVPCQFGGRDVLFMLAGGRMYWWYYWGSKCVGLTRSGEGVTYLCS